MKLPLDMNPSSSWAERLAGQGMEAVHWLTIGAATAPARPRLDDLVDRARSGECSATATAAKVVYLAIVRRVVGLVGPPGWPHP